MDTALPLQKKDCVS